MEYLYIAVVVLVMVSITALYFVIGYRFIKKHKGGKNADN